MKILFIGEVPGGSAEYTRDCYLYLNHTVTHIANTEEAPVPETTFDVIVISDYPARLISPQTSAALITQVNDGARLIMVGGWDSFNGRGTNYHGHAITGILPVEVSPEDDRQNVPQGLILTPTPELGETPSLDWKIAPVICGYNNAVPKPDAAILVEGRPIITDGIRISFGTPAVPIVSKTSCGSGSTLACLTDLAPHWCGGLVDWGTERIKLQHVEIGTMFIQFINLLLTV